MDTYDVAISKNGFVGQNLICVLRGKTQIGVDRGDSLLTELQLESCKDKTVLLFNCGFDPKIVEELKEKAKSVEITDFAVAFEDMPKWAKNIVDVLATYDVKNVDWHFRRGTTWLAREQGKNMTELFSGFKKTGLTDELYKVICVKGKEITETNYMNAITTCEKAGVRCNLGDYKAFLIYGPVSPTVSYNVASCDYLEDVTVGINVRYNPKKKVTFMSFLTRDKEVDLAALVSKAPLNGGGTKHSAGATVKGFVPPVTEGESFLEHVAKHVAKHVK